MELIEAIFCSLSLYTDVTTGLAVGNIFYVFEYFHYLMRHWVLKWLEITRSHFCFIRSFTWTNTTYPDLIKPGVKRSDLIFGVGWLIFLFLSEWPHVIRIPDCSPINVATKTYLLEFCCDLMSSALPNDLDEAKRFASNTMNGLSFIFFVFESEYMRKMLARTQEP
jgi:hypothetical protein